MGKGSRGEEVGVKRDNCVRLSVCMYVHVSEYGRIIECTCVEGEEEGMQLYHPQHVRYCYFSSTYKVFASNRNATTFVRTID
jgi:hypothetical protein